MVRKVRLTDLQSGTRLTHPKEYNSWKNMKSRAKQEGRQVHPAFERFGDFLKAMGPIPVPGHTLDRMDRTLNLYSPENCRWASKTEQTNNRRTTIMVMFGGEMLPITEVARRTGQRPETLRKRKKRGLSDHEVVYGRAQPLSPNPGILSHVVATPPTDPGITAAAWVGTEEQRAYWLGWWRYGVEEDDYILPLSLEEEPFDAFVYRFASELLQGLQAGSVNTLPGPIRRGINAMSGEAKERYRIRLLSLIDSARARLPEFELYTDPVWEGDHSNDIDFIPRVRTAIRWFRNNQRRLPPALIRLWEVHAAQLMIGPVPPISSDERPI